MKYWICEHSLRIFKKNISMIPCGHIFHTNCIQILRKCPRCRRTFDGQRLKSVYLSQLENKYIDIHRRLEALDEENQKQFLRNKIILWRILFLAVAVGLFSGLVAFLCLQAAIKWFFLFDLMGFLFALWTRLCILLMSVLLLLNQLNQSWSVATRTLTASSWRIMTFGELLFFNRYLICWMKAAWILAKEKIENWER